MLLTKPSEWPSHKSFRLGRLELAMPSVKDPRYYFWLLQISFFLLLITQVHLFRPSAIWALFAACSTGFVLDLLLTYLRKGKLVFPQSGLITGSGISLILEASSVWFYVFAVGVGICAKHLFTFRGRHIFNPNAYGLLFTLSLFPATAVAFAAQWGNSMWMPAYVACTGILITYAAGALNTALFWLASFTFFALLRAAVLDVPFLFTMAPATGGAFMLFSFFMITDPRTVSKDWRLRVFFCVLVALIDAVFRTMENHLSLFWALFIGYALFVTVQSWLEKGSPVHGTRAL